MRRFSAAKPLNVVTVHNRYLMRGGEDEVFESEARLLREYGCNVHMISQAMTDPAGLVAKARIGINAVWSDGWYEKFRRQLAAIRPDVVHIHNFFPLISPSIYYACRDAGVPVVQTLHNYRLLCPGATFYRDGKICEDCLQGSLLNGVVHGCYRDSKLGTAAAALMLKVHRRRETWSGMVDRYVALTEFSRQKFIEGGLPAERIVVKPNFVLPDPGQGKEKGDYALFVGRLADLKGVPTLLKAWKQLPEPIPLMIAGDGPYRAQLEAELKQAGLSTVNYRGRLSRAETLAAMQGARFLIFPSEWYEGFPVTMAESFACGTPVICSRLGSMAEIVADGVTGLHFEAGSADDLANRVRWAWNHPAEITAMSLAARAEFEARYGAERNYEMLMDIYEGVIAERG
jgi:glycosyltransferase involved in cell wall biosynthesis